MLNPLLGNKGLMSHKLCVHPIANLKKFACSTNLVKHQRKKSQLFRQKVVANQDGGHMQDIVTKTSVELKDLILQASCHIQTVMLVVLLVLVEMDNPIGQGLEWRYYLQFNITTYLLH